MSATEAGWYACATVGSSVAHLSQPGHRVRSWCDLPLDLTEQRDAWRRCKHCQAKVARYVDLMNQKPPELASMEFVIKVTRPTEDWQSEPFQQQIARKFRSNKRTTIEFVEPGREVPQ